MLKPQDILVLLKLSIEPERPTYLRLAQQLHLNPSEVHAQNRAGSFSVAADVAAWIAEKRF
jgi:hypothetical protein